MAVNTSTIKASGGDYTTLTLWETGIEGDLVTAETAQVAECYGYSGVNALDDRVTIEGSTTSTDYYIKVTSPSSERHDGTDTGFTIAPTTDGTPITVMQQDTIIEWLNVKGWTGNYAGGISVTLGTSATSRIRNNIVHDSTYSYSKGIHVVLSYSGQAFVYNNIIYNITAANARAGISLYRGSGTSVNSYAYNNTIYNIGQRAIWFDNSYADGIVKNNIGEQYFNIVWNAGSTHNTSESTTYGYLAGGESYSAGTATSTSAGKLVDSAATFQTDGVKVGCVIKNTTDTTYTYVTSVDSETQLTVNNDIFVATETYIVYTNRFASPVHVDESGYDFHLASNDTVAIGQGVNLTSDAALPFSNDIDNETRPSSGAWCIGADEYVSATTGNIKKIAGINWANVKKVGGVPVANIKKVAGVTA